MKAKIKDSHTTKHQQDSKIIQLSEFTELSDQELELLVGGWSSSKSTTLGSSVSNTSGSGKS